MSTASSTSSGWKYFATSEYTASGGNGAAAGFGLVVVVTTGLVVVVVEDVVVVGGTVVVVVVVVVVVLLVVVEACSVSKSWENPNAACRPAAAPISAGITTVDSVAEVVGTGSV